MWRSLLFVPGDSPRKINKIRELDADAVILDLEDAVAASEKEGARQIVCEALASVDFGRSDRLVRINGTETHFFSADLTAVVQARPEGLVIPKVESPAELVQIDETMTAAELAHTWPAGSIRLLALIETALGIMNIKAIAQCTSRLDALLFGAEDLSADMGAVRTTGGWEIFYGRGAVVTAATAYGLQAIDTVFVDVHDQEGLNEDAAFARRMGYKGKMAIHPGQIGTINEVFCPSAAEIAGAERLLQQAAQEEAAGSGVFMIDGRMVDAPLLRAAEGVLQQARLCGLID